MRALLTLLATLTIPGQTPGTIETIAGTGIAGYSGDGGKAIEARLNAPFHCAFDEGGTLYVADTMNHRIRKVDAGTGVISTVAGSGRSGNDGDGGPAVNAALGEPYAVAIEPHNGDVYIVDRTSAVVRKVDGKSGVITTVAGNSQHDYSGDGGAATKAALREPNDCCLDGHGGLLIADVADWRVRRLDLRTGVITTFAGTGRAAAKPDRLRLGDGGPATEAVIPGARAVCVDGRGNTYICEREGNAIRKVNSAGVIGTFAGTGQKGYVGDGGPAASATFNGPKGIRCDAQGNVYVVDTENHAIRRIDAKTNFVTTCAGRRKGAEGDLGDAKRAGLDRPHGCVIDSAGIIYIADSGNHRVRRVAAP